jgi:hypothetical protein
VGIPIASERNTRWSSLVARWCFAPPLWIRSSRRLSCPEFTSASLVTGMPWFTPITSRLRHSPSRITGSPATRRFSHPNATSITNDASRIANASQWAMLVG